MSVVRYCPKADNRVAAIVCFVSLAIYYFSVSGPTPGLGSGLDEMEVAVRIVSYSVTTTTPGTGSSITSMIVSSTGTSTACLGFYLGAFLAAIFACRSSAKIRLCPLLSESGQTWARSECPLSANSGIDHWGVETEKATF